MGGFYVCKNGIRKYGPLLKEVQVINNVNTVKRIIKRPDGTVEKRYKIVDKREMSKSKRLLSR